MTDLQTAVLYHSPRKLHRSADHSALDLACNPARRGTLVHLSDHEDTERCQHQACFGE